MSEQVGQEIEFVFGEPLRSLLLKYWLQDKENAKLSLKFRLYYLLRPFIPIPLRQFLQKSRNQSLDIASDWFLPKAFLEELKGKIAAQAVGSLIHPWPDGHRYSVCLTHDVETDEGQKKISEIAAFEERLGLRSAWYFIPHKYKVDLGLIEDLKARGHEVGIHGYNHDGRLFTSRSIFNYRAKYINQAGRKFDSSGFRAPMVHRNLEWMQALEFDYDASCFDVDPFQAMPGGVGGVWPFIVGKLVELPYTLPQDHTLLISLGERTPRIWLEKLELIKRMSGMAMLITHPDYLDVPERLSVYQQFCEHVAQQADSWKVLPQDISKWWRQRSESNLVNARNGQLEICGSASQRGKVASVSEVVNLPD